MAEENHGVVTTLFPGGIPAFGRPPSAGPADRPATPEAAPPIPPGLRYEQDAHGRYLVTDAGILATITGLDGLAAQRAGRELAAAPLALDAIGWALDDLDALAGALAGRGITSDLVAEIRDTLIAALRQAGRPTERYQPRAGTTPPAPRRG